MATDARLLVVGGEQTDVDLLAASATTVGSILSIERVNDAVAAIIALSEARANDAHPSDTQSTANPDAAAPTSAYTLIIDATGDPDRAVTRAAREVHSDWPPPIVLLADSTDATTGSFDEYTLDVLTRAELRSNPHTLARILRWTAGHAVLSEEGIEAERRFLSVVDRHPAVVIMFDLEAQVVYVNAMAEQMLASPRGSLLLRPLPMVETTEAETLEAAFAVARAGEVTQVTVTLHDSHGHNVPVQMTLIPITSRGTIAAIYAAALDLREQRAAELRAQEETRRLEALAAASAAFAEESTDLQRVLDTVVEHILHDLGDACCVRLLSEDGQALESVAAGALDADVLKDPRLTCYIDEPVPIDSPYLPAPAVHAGRSIRIEEVDRDQIDPRLHPALVATLGTSRVQSVLSVLLRVGGRIIGVLMTLRLTPDRSYTAADERFLQNLADRAAQAIENARLYEQSQEAEMRYRVLVERLPAMTYIGAIDDRITASSWISPQVAEITGFTAEEISANPDLWVTIVHPDDRERVIAEAARTNQMGEPLSIEYRIIARDGTQRWLHNQAVLVRDGETPRYWQGIISDITAQKTLEQQLAHQAFHDALTDLPNRLLFYDRVDQALARSRRGNSGLAVLFIDIDNFKVVNDSLGHDVGDMLLRELAGRIARSIRAEDTAARLGGDEFAVLLEGIEREEDAARVARVLLATLRTPVLIGARKVVAAASIGVALGRGAHDSAELLLRNADVAMYNAKRGGRARYSIFEPAMAAEAVQRMELEQQLRRSIEHGELHIQYQPIYALGQSATPPGIPQIAASAVGLATDPQGSSTDIGVGTAIVDRGAPTRPRLAMLEALVRWPYPDVGVIPPDGFLPLAEETGLIEEIGRWVLHEACRQFADWRAQFPIATDLRLHINLSQRQLVAERLVEDVLAALRLHAVPPSALSIEVTENVMLADEATAQATLLRLRILGVGVAVDDFGTGYSSLAFLRRLPADMLKLHNTFIQGVGDPETSDVLVTSVLGLAHGLGLQVIAEGVESLADMERLEALGCDYAQGHLLGRPMDAAQMRALLAQVDRESASERDHDPFAGDDEAISERPAGIHLI